MNSPPDSRSNLIRFTRAHYPARLMVDPQYALDHLILSDEEHDIAEQLVNSGQNKWLQIVEGKGNDQFLASAKYLAVSYRRGSYKQNLQDSALDLDLAEKLFENIIHACSERNLSAYWLDEHCMAATWPEKNYDLYRIADVFRGASATVIMIPEHDNDGQSTPNYGTSNALGEGSHNEPDQAVLANPQEWGLWGSRVWTLPEVLLSRNLFYKIGDGPTTAIALRQFANIAFRLKTDRDNLAEVIDHYSGKDTLSRLELLSLLKDAIWRRGAAEEAERRVGPPMRERASRDQNESQILSITSNAHASLTSNTSPVVASVPSQAPPATNVYALMGFYQHRILPDNEESEMMAGFGQTISCE
jgi:Heterokaryon incompatibility protein (HET)